MKKLLAVILLLLAAQAQAREVAGVHLDEFTKLADANLRLNGAGVRTKFIFKVYVIGLYLGPVANDFQTIENDGGPKRILMVMKRNVSGKALLDAFKEGIEANNSPLRLKALATSITEFSTIFEVHDEVKEGDVITIDYITGFGTHVTLNGTEIGMVMNPEFYPALLKVWLGNDPVDEDLKRALLGKQ